MEGDGAVKKGPKRGPDLARRLAGYAAGMLVEILTVAALGAAAIVVMLVVKALA